MPLVHAGRQIRIWQEGENPKYFLSALLSCDFTLNLHLSHRFLQETRCSDCVLLYSQLVRGKAESKAKELGVMENRDRVVCFEFLIDGKLPLSN